MTDKWRAIAATSDAISHGLTAEEFAGVGSKLGRSISVLELGIVAALFSEHCSYKSTKVHLKNLPTVGPRVMQGPGENAGVIDIGDGECVVFKVESHNHPSFIEPYQGAATGVGGILRDVFTMGARPLALMNGLRFGHPDNPKTSTLLRRAVAGIGGYGNCVGVPTLGGELYFDASYNGNCLVNAFALGVAKHEDIYLGRAAGVGNPVIYFGSKTGRDGIRGANMASEGFDENSEEKRPTVQVGDPFQEKLLIEATLELLKSGCVVGIQDMGAAGMTCACYEMADRANSGVRIDLDKVPQREDGMNPYEIMLSESQERMVAVVTKGREHEALAIINRWELDAAVIGEVIDGGLVDLLWHQQLISSIPAQLLTASVPQYRWPEEAPHSSVSADDRRYSGDGKRTVDRQPALNCTELGAALLEIVGDINGCSRRRVFEQYDSTVRSNSVGVAEAASNPGTLGDAGVIRIKGWQIEDGPIEDGQIKDRRNPNKGLAMTLDCNSRYCGISPRQGTALSLAEALRNLACVGAEPLGISDCLNCGSPERPSSMWQIAECIRGLGESARAFDVPVVSGNVSLYNETRGEPILPTPTLAVVGLVDDVTTCVPSFFRSTAGDDHVLVVGSDAGMTLAGSLFDQVLKKPLDKTLPVLIYDQDLLVCAAIRDLVRSRLLRSCHDVSDGGLAAALAECCVSQGVGAELTVAESHIKNFAPEVLAFGEGGCRFVISCCASTLAQVLALLARVGVQILARGHVRGDTIRIENVLDVPVEKARMRWNTGLDSLFENISPHRLEKVASPVPANQRRVSLPVFGAPVNRADARPVADKFHDECGVMGIWNGPQAANLVYLGLYQQQHRGQEGAGVVSMSERGTGGRWTAHRGLGLVSEVFNHFDFEKLPGQHAIGHVRYSTAGGSRIENIQPFYAELATGRIAVAHNGNIVNADTLRVELKKKGAIFSATSDTEVILHLAAHAPTNVPPVERIISVLKQLRGAYSLLIMLDDRLYAARDPHGIRPLVMGECGEGIAFASETCAFNILDVTNVREVAPGEIVEVQGDRTVKSYMPFPAAPSAACIFEHVYFARPDSEVFGRHVQSVRRRLGEQLAREHPVAADLVIPVPDSGVFAALGYSSLSKIPYDMGLIRNHYIGRTFIEPAQGIRDFGVKLKLSANKQIVSGKRLIVVDDSLVRGTTSKKLVSMLRAAGATTIHLMISSPPTTNPCFYGIDTPSKGELIASHMTQEEIRAFIGADSLHYLSLEGLHAAANSTPSTFCDACFSGRYRAGTPHDFEPRQVPLL